MSRPYDFALFGATGFTGQWVAVALARAASSAGRRRYTFALSGRDERRLREVIERVRREVPGADVEAIGIVLADARDSASLLALARSARIVITTAGPFRLLGEGLLRACIAEKAHYLDISGEPYFMERMQMELSAAATAAGVLAVSSAGFDSIPADCGAEFALATAREAGGLPVSVESFLTISGGPAGLAVNFGTFESAVLGFGSTAALRKLRAGVPPLRMPALGGLPRRHEGLFFEPRMGRWCYPFLGADASVVRRSQRAGIARGTLLAEAPHSLTTAAMPALPTPYLCYMTLPSPIAAGLFLLYGSIFQALARWAWGRALLLAAPGIFTHGLFTRAGPTREQIAGARFEMTHFVRSFSRERAAAALERAALGGAAPQSAPPPDLHTVVRVRGPEPGYDATSRILVAAALTLLEEGSVMLAAGGCGAGVHAPGNAFSGTQLIQRLREEGISFDVLQRGGPEA